MTTADTPYMIVYEAYKHTCPHDFVVDASGNPIGSLAVELRLGPEVFIKPSCEHFITERMKLVANLAHLRLPTEPCGEVDFTTSRTVGHIQAPRMLPPVAAQVRLLCVASRRRT